MGGVGQVFFAGEMSGCSPVTHDAGTRRTCDADLTASERTFNVRLCPPLHALRHQRGGIPKVPSADPFILPEFVEHDERGVLRFG